MSPGAQERERPVTEDLGNRALAPEIEPTDPKKRKPPATRAPEPMSGKDRSVKIFITASPSTGD